MAQIELEPGATIQIGELLKIHPRDDVVELMLRFGIAADDLHARFMIAITLGETKGDVIDVSERHGKE